MHDDEYAEETVQEYNPEGLNRWITVVRRKRRCQRQLEVVYQKMLDLNAQLVASIISG